MKNTITTIALALVITFGATFANAGIIIGDRSAPCTEATDSKDGIIIGDLFREVVGIIIGDRGGILVSDKSDTCTKRDGIIIGDREGIIIGD